MHTLLFLLLMTDAPKAAEPPKVTDAEQIELLIVQRDELATENAALKAKLARIDKVNHLSAAWTARGCEVIGKPDGTLDCKPRPTAPPESDEKKK
jgi:hypothetical protein